MSGFNIFSINDEDRKRPAIIGLLGLLKSRDVEIKKLKDEISRLKNHPKRPKLQPSKISQNDKSIGKDRKKKSCPKKDSVEKKIEIHETQKLRPKNIPKGSKLIKTRSYTVQNIIIKAKNIKYICEIWKTPDGKYLKGALPSINKSHYGNELNAYILNLYYGAHISQKAISDNSLI